MTDLSTSDNGRVLWGIGTARTFRAHWALIELGLDYRTERIQTRTPQMEQPRFLAINPKMKIPTLVDHGFVLTETPAILTYLAEQYGGPENPLLPSDIQGRARCFEWMAFASMELDATTLYVLRRHESLPQIYGEAPVANTASREYFARMIEAGVVRLDSGGSYLLGDPFTIADIVMTTVLDWAIAYDVPVPHGFLAYRDRVAERPAYQAAVKVNSPS